MEKHWKSVISRSVCDYFFDAQNKASRFVSTCIKVLIDVFLCHCCFFSFADVPPVIATPHHFLINIYRCNIFLVAVITSEGKGV